MKESNKRDKQENTKNKKQSKQTNKQTNESYLIFDASQTCSANKQINREKGMFEPLCLSDMLSKQTNKQINNEKHV